MNFALPLCIGKLLEARDEVRAFYRKQMGEDRAANRLKFAFDGNLLGDLGEALAVLMFDIRLVHASSAVGFDGYAPDGKTTVQVKVTGSGRGPAFRRTETRANHLLFFDLDFASMSGCVVYNGPEAAVVSLLPTDFKGQRSVSRRAIERLDASVLPSQRLTPAPLSGGAQEWVTRWR